MQHLRKLYEYIVFINKLNKNFVNIIVKKTKTKKLFSILLINSYNTIFGATPVLLYTDRAIVFISCGACKPEQTQKDLLIKVDAEPHAFHDL